ncbi:rna-directed dna polymerase from mobile element jockey-like [Willisornis vidua]|uniref:Rna-directed dna polymerase from mobile element jockey-like n=1 Tax=Willisornis vidua TaxID=1566151 RepID=A0ABQ9CXA8_9PASS|nr:rna-directed dna polymerase from mobile element jockey-like [Willisornis vidua]
MNEKRGKAISTTHNASGSPGGPLLINDLDEGVDAFSVKFDDDTKLGGVVNTPACCAALEKDLDRLEIRAEKTHLKFNKDKCRVQNLRSNNLIHQYSLGAELLEDSSAVKNLGC